MELGKAKLRRNGMNSLQNALHPDHGLIWTDGKGIFLAPIHLSGDQVENSSSIRLGEFEHVQSVHWSCTVDHGACYMAAVHQQNVTVWHVSGVVPRLAFKQVRKISVQPVPQGCLWNPKTDVLCLLSRQQCSFYFRHSHNRGSFAFPSLENEKISCGCWSPDGKRLVICVGTALLIYTWNDVEASINDFVTTAWRIPRMSGSVTAIVPASNSAVVCASDLPLDVLCHNNNRDSFVVPEIAQQQPGSEDVIRARGGMSLKDSLLNLQPSPKDEVQDAAMLSMIQLKSGTQDPVVLTSTTVSGLLSPDLLHFQVESQCVVVGSNTQSGVQVFALIDNQLVLAGHMSMEKGQRPKGICGLQTSQTAGSDGVLVLVGTAEPVDPTFPTAYNIAAFTLSLRYFPTHTEKAKRLLNGHATSAKSASCSSVVKSDSLHEKKIKRNSDSHLLHKDSHTDEQPEHRLQLLDEEKSDGNSIRLSLATTNSGTSRPKLVQEITDNSHSPHAVDSTGERISCPEMLEVEKVEFSQSSPSFHNSVLSEKYEMNSSRDSPNRNKTVSTSQSSVSSHQDSKNDGKKMEKMSNGHVSVDKPVSSRTESSLDRVSVDRGNVLVSPQDASNPQLSQGKAEMGGKPSPDDAGSVCSSFNSSDSNYEVLEKQIQSQRDQIDALQKRLADLSEMVQDTACVFPVRYQKMSEPEALTIHCVVGGVRVSRKFLLDNGRLQLEPVKNAFGLQTVELILDGEPLVLGANIDGYIPLKFSPNSVLQVTGIPMSYTPQVLPEKSKKDSSQLENVSK